MTDDATRRSLFDERISVIHLGVAGSSSNPNESVTLAISYSSLLVAVPAFHGKDTQHSVPDSPRIRTLASVVATCSISLRMPCMASRGHSTIRNLVSNS